MAASSFASIHTVESAVPPLPQPPTAAVQWRTSHTIDNQIELGQVPDSVNVPKTLDVETPPTMPIDDNSAGNIGSSAEQIQTIWNPYKNRFRVLACCTTAFGQGMNDSAPGALIASLER
jgi:hypothetical protein